MSTRDWLLDPGSRRFRWGLALALGFGGAAASLLPSLLALDETLGLGGLFALRGPVPAPADAVVVGIYRDTAAALGQTAELDTWSRELHARLIGRAAAAGVSAIAFDLVFEDARDEAGDTAFARSIERAASVLLVDRTQADSVALGGAGEAELQTRVPPLPMLTSAALSSVPFVLPTVPVRVSQFWAFGRALGDTPSLPAAALQTHLLAHYADFVRLLEVVAPGTTTGWPRDGAELVATRALEDTMRAARRAFLAQEGLVDAARAQIPAVARSESAARALAVLVDLYGGSNSRYLNFYGPARAVPTLPYDQVLAGAHDAEIAGKTLFIGLAEARQSEQQDDFHSIFSEQSGQNLSGVEIAATAFANLLERDTIEPLSMPQHLALVLGVGGLFGWIIAPLATRRALALGALGAVAYATAAYGSFAAYSLWIPTVVPLLAVVPLGCVAVVWRNYAALGLQRERVQAALGRYVPAQLAERLAQQTVSLGAGKRLLHGTCLYSDAEHYTTVAEALGPEELAGLMNEYFATLFRVVTQHGGEISDTAGDAMVAVWAAAEPDGAVRARAVQAALAIEEAVEAFNAAQPRWRLPTRIGLASGELLLGNIGAEQRYEYRAIGDIVNTAARLQELNRLLGTRALVAESTLDGVVGVATRPLGSFVLRGKRAPVRVFELITTRASEPAELAAFSTALAAFGAGAWREAEEAFAGLAERCPHDGPTRYFRELAGRYRREPPARWTGDVVLAR